MRLRIAHSTVYRYEPPATGVIQVLRLTPRNHDGQYVIRWRIDVSADTRLAAHEDAFGNLTHVFSADGPFAELNVEVVGEVETQNTEGVVRGAVERFPPSLYLRSTPLTEADAALRDFTNGVRRDEAADVLAELHMLLQRLHEEMTHEVEAPAEPVAAAAAFARKGGATADLVHIFLSAARSLDIPARYVCGYFCPETTVERRADHAWAEAFVPDLGWVGFDPVEGACPTEAYVRVAIGLDSIGAAAVRGTRYGVSEETREVAVKVGQ